MWYVVRFADGWCEAYAGDEERRGDRVYPGENIHEAIARGGRVVATFADCRSAKDDAGARNEPLVDRAAARRRRMFEEGFSEEHIS